MSDFRISIPGGEARRLKTGGKYCPSDIVVEATGGGGGGTGIFATLVAPPSNQSTLPAITSYANNVDMEGDDV